MSTDALNSDLRPAINLCRSGTCWWLSSGRGAAMLRIVNHKAEQFYGLRRSPDSRIRLTFDTRLTQGSPSFFTATLMAASEENLLAFPQPPSPGQTGDTGGGLKTSKWGIVQRNQHSFWIWFVIHQTGAFLGRSTCVFFFISLSRNVWYVQTFQGMKAEILN